MNYQSNQPLFANVDYPPTQGAIPVWSKVFTKPGEKTFLEIIDHPEAKAKAAYIWIFIMGTLSGLISSVTQFIVGLAGVQQAMPEVGQLPGMTGMLGAAGLFGAICGAPIAGVFSVIAFSIGVGIVQATARFFGGQGSYDKLAYAFGAIAAPLSLISALMVPFNAIPFVAFCTVPVLLALSLYALFLQVTAIKAVHRCGWGEATAALLLPGILIALLCGFLFLVVIRMAGPSLNELFQQMQGLQ